MMEDYGLIYLLKNEAMPGMVKIGKTTRTAESRIRELYTTGIPLPFECLCACRVPVAHLDLLEKAIHTAFAPARVNKGREFFRISPEQAIPLFNAITALCGMDATSEVNDIIEDGLNEDDQEAVNKAKRRPRLDFFELGLMEGSILHFVRDTTINTTIADARHVCFEGVVRSLSSVTAELLGKDYNVQPSSYWLYEGETLLAIYDRKFPISKEDE